MALIIEKQDLTYLQWSHIRSSSGTAGTFLKSQSNLEGKKTYYKLSNFDITKGVVGHECVNEIIVDRLLTILGVEHLGYNLIYADIEVEHNVYSTYLCSSLDFKKKGDSKIALDDFYRTNSIPGESHYEFCKRMGWQDYIDTMIAVDYLILNRDRHGANIEILRNSKERTIKVAPLFDHGLSLMYSCMSDEEVSGFDIHEDKKCQNFIGGYSCYENLELIEDKNRVFPNRLEKSHKSVIFEGLENVISQVFIDKIWNMIYERYEIFEDLRNN